MSSLAEFCAAILLWLSSMALCQFGMTVEREVKPPPKAERVIARSPRRQAVQSVEPGVERCPQGRVIAVNA